MRTILTCGLLLLAACGGQQVPTPEKHPDPEVIVLDYMQKDIQKQFDTLYNGRRNARGVNLGFIEQALASCHSRNPDTITQDVLSSMFLDDSTGIYDCVTQTTFRFKNGIICAMGVFNLVPGDSIAPDHDFPITGGSGAYSNIYGTYTRKYRNGVYHVELRYYPQR